MTPIDVVKHIRETSNLTKLKGEIIMTNERKLAIQEKALKNLYDYYLFQNIRANYFDGAIDKEEYDEQHIKFYNSYKLDVTDEDIEDFHYLEEILPEATNNEIFHILKVNNLEMLRRIIWVTQH